MRPDVIAPKIAFAAALAVLVAAVFAMAALGGKGGGGQPVVARPGHARGPVLGRAGRESADRGAQTRAAEVAARGFVHAYLRYQEGHLGGEDREALVRYSTSDLGAQLVSAPVRVPVQSAVPRQFLARVAALRAGLFDGTPAYLIAVVLAGASGSHLLNVSVVESEGRWVVAGVGP